MFSSGMVCIWSIRFLLLFLGLFCIMVFLVKLFLNFRVVWEKVFLCSVGYMVVVLQKVYYLFVLSGVLGFLVVWVVLCSLVLNVCRVVLLVDQCWILLFWWCVLGWMMIRFRVLKVYWSLCVLFSVQYSFWLLFFILMMMFWLCLQLMMEMWLKGRYSEMLLVLNIGFQYILLFMWNRCFSGNLLVVVQWMLFGLMQDGFFFQVLKLKLKLISQLRLNWCLIFILVCGFMCFILLCMVFRQICIVFVMLVLIGKFLWFVGGSLLVEVCIGMEMLDVVIFSMELVGWCIVVCLVGLRWMQLFSYFQAWLLLSRQALLSVCVVVFSCVVGEELLGCLCFICMEFRQFIYCFVFDVFFIVWMFGMLVYQCELDGGVFEGYVVQVVD